MVIAEGVVCNQDLLKETLNLNKNVEIISNEKSKTIFSFFLKNKSSIDLAEYLSKKNIFLINYLKLNFFLFSLHLVKL